MNAAQIRVFNDLKDLSRETARCFVEFSQEAIRARGFCSVALSGGSTPRAFHHTLSGPEFQERVQWSDIYFFWGDERCVPLHHSDSNYKMAKESLLSKVPVPEKNIFPIHTENHAPREAAIAYENTLRSFFATEEQFPRFDLIFLGLGEDGHTASLFPHSSALQERNRWSTENYVEKLKSHRITLTVPVLNNAANVLFLVSGASKTNALREVLRGSFEPHRLPAQMIRPEAGQLMYLVDRESAAGLGTI